MNKETVRQITREIEREEQHVRKELLDRIGNLARRLQDAQKKVEMGYNPASLGEVQGEGSNIDRLCGELCKLREIRQTVVDITSENEPK